MIKDNDINDKDIDETKIYTIKGRTQRDYCLDLVRDNPKFKKEIIGFLNYKKKIDCKKDLNKMNNYELCNIIIDNFFDVQKMSY